MSTGAEVFVLSSEDEPTGIELIAAKSEGTNKSSDRAKKVKYGGRQQRPEDQPKKGLGMAFLKGL